MAGICSSCTAGAGAACATASGRAQANSQTNKAFMGESKCMRFLGREQKCWVLAAQLGNELGAQVAEDLANDKAPANGWA
ncbi:hypothetical protein GCM10027511_21710 [Hymenobacter humi]